MPKSTAVKEQEKDELKQEYQMTEDERRAYAVYIQRFNAAKAQRQVPMEYFDDMTYEQDYVANRRAGLTYLKKKKNDSDVRVNTSTTEKKLEVVWTELTSMNLKPEVRAYDQDDIELLEVGNEFTDIVRRTNEIEHDEDKMNEAYREMLTQRAVFVQELYIERIVRDKLRSKSGYYTIRRCEKKVLSGLQVYLADMFLPAYRFNEQPYIMIYERMTYEQAKTIYGNNPKWQYVKPGTGSKEWYGGIFDYRLNSVNKNEVEIIHYLSYQDDEYNCMINGVMFYAPGEKLPYEYEGYNVTMVCVSPIPGFAYGKGLVSSAKTLQALSDETIRNLIFKFRQAIKPPSGVAGGRIYSRDIWNPGAMTQGASKKNIESLIDHQGVTSSEFNLFQLIESKTNEFIGTANLQRQVNPSVTATQILQEQKEAIKLLGQSIFGAMRLVSNVTMLRIYNILENETKSLGKKKNPYNNKIENAYRKYSIAGAELENGLIGRKVLQFTDRPLEQEEKESIYQYEEEMSKKIGEPFRIKFLNVEKLREIPQNWFVAVITQAKDTSQLSQAMFQDKLNQAATVAQLTGRPLNSDKVVEDFEKTWKVKDMFQKQAPQQQIMPEQLPQMSGQTPQSEALQQSINIKQNEPKQM